MFILFQHTLWEMPAENSVINLLNMFLSLYSYEDVIWRLQDCERHAEILAEIFDLRKFQNLEKRAFLFSSLKGHVTQALNSQNSCHG